MPLRDEMAHQLIFGSKALALAVAAAIILPPADCRAQSLPASLNIVDVRGEGAKGRVGQRTTEHPAIRVVDEKESPVAGAVVVFTTPTEGATGFFANGAKTLAVVTDAGGLAIAQGLRFNEVPGKVQVHVNASYKGLTARSNITQYSEAPAGYKAPRRAGGGKIVAVVAILAAGGAAGAVFATRKSSGSSSAAITPAAAIGITPGTGALAPPH